MSREEIISEYDRFVQDSSEDDVGKIQCFGLVGNDDIFRSALHIVLHYDFMLAHVKLDKQDVDVSSTERYKSTLRYINKWCKRIHKHVGNHSMFVVLFSGRMSKKAEPGSMNGNGACFINIKKNVEFA